MLKTSKIKKINKFSEDNNEEGNQVDMEEADYNLLDMEINYGEEGNAKESNTKKEEEDIESQSSIMHSNVAPEEWQREVEKASSKLKIDNANVAYTTGEWRGHIDQIKTYNTVFIYF